MDITPFVLSGEDQVALKFGYTYKQLSSLIYPTPNKSYQSFSIPKKNGEDRTIHAPCLKLLKIQRILAEDLGKHYVPRNGVHGFIKNRSIVSNARRHINKRYVFNIDLKDFFGTIHFGRVRNLLQAQPFNYSQPAATILAQICCYQGALPQGAPTSPLISNLICWKMDAQLQQLASQHHCTYSRYADDITFSFDVPKTKIPKSIVRLNNRTQELSVGSLLATIIKDNGFTINYEKVRLQSRNQRQEVTGITVNNKLNLKRSFIRKTSSMLHAWKKFGAAEAEHEYLTKYRLKTPYYWQTDYAQKNPGDFFIKVVKGRINYIQMVKGSSDPVYRKLAYRLTEALGKPNQNFKKSREELATFVLENLPESTQGSGFLLEGVGLITNYHVIEGMTDENYALWDIFRYEEEDKKRKCPLIYQSKVSDIAILKPHDAWKGTPQFKLGDDRSLKIGSEITVVGFPSYSPHSTPHITKGSIIGKKVLFGIDAWIVNTSTNHGFSGGPVLNELGQVIGVATFGAKNNDGTEINGFIPASILKQIIESKNYLDLILYGEIAENASFIDFTSSKFIFKDQCYCRACYDSKLISTLSDQNSPCPICSPTSNSA